MLPGEGVVVLRLVLLEKFPVLAVVTELLEEFPVLAVVLELLE